MKYIKLLLAAVALISSTSAASVNGECGGNFGKCPTGYCCSKFGYCGKSEDHCGVGCQSKFGKCNTTKKVTTTTKKTVKTTTTTKKAAKASTTINPATKKTTKKTTTTKKVTTTKKTTTTKNITTTTINQSLPVSTNGMCGPEHGICPGTSCCSQFNYCGKSEEHCGAGCNPAYGMCNDTTSNTTTTTTTKKIVTTTTKKITTTTKKTTTTKSTKPTSEKIISTDGLCGPENGNTTCPDGYCCSQYGYCGKEEGHCGDGCRSEFGKCGYTPEEKVTGFQYYDQCVNKKHWALTFDDGPYKYDLALLSLLRKLDVKATFFINGANVMDIKTAQAKEIIQTMNKDGHIVASHTWSHSNIEKISKSEIISEMTKLEDYIYKYIGKKPAFMRPPYGAGDGNAEIAKTLKSLGYTAACMWNVDTLDWDKTGDVDYALSEFKKYVKKNVGILSLNHNYYGTISESSLLTLVEAEVKYMRSQGYTPVTMDECLGLKAYQ